MTCPLRSTGLPRFVTTIGQSDPEAPLPYSRPRGCFHLWLLRLHRCLRFPRSTRPLWQAQATSQAGLSPDLVVARPFPSAFTTMAFGYSRRRWFETCSCTPVPRAPLSVEQFRTTQRFLRSCSWHTYVARSERLGLVRTSAITRHSGSIDSRSIL